MGGYQYNPLIPLNLQKRSAVSPEDIQRIEGEISELNEDITDINGDLKNKVPKIFTSIEEIKVGEIGEYQGVTNETFTHGYFYERGSGTVTTEFVSTGETKRMLKKINYSIEPESPGLSYFAVFEDFLTGTIPVNVDSGEEYITSGVYLQKGIGGTQYLAMVIPDVFGIKTAYHVENDDLFKFTYPGTSESLYANGYLLYCSKTGAPLPILSYEPGRLVIQDGSSEVVISLADGWNCNGAASIKGVSYDVFVFVDNKLTPAILLPFMSLFTWVVVVDNSNFVRFSYPGYNQSSGLVNFPFDVSEWDSYWMSSTDYEEYTLVATESPSITRVDTQPALNPADFATAGQGAKADTALQAITHGTDGDYVTSTIGAKDANNEQSVSVSLKLQPISTAGSGAKGLAEASDVRNFFNVIAAESEAYGVMWDSANPSPNLSRIGNMRNHALLPVQSAMIGGVLADDGTFTPFDNQADWTQATQARDGSDGQVMVRLPRHWRRFEKSGTYNIVMISPIEIPGYVEVRQQYVSAYEATLQHSTSKLCSVNNADADYRGGQNDASWDGTYRTLLNRPITNYNLAEFRTFARNRANNTKWNCLTYEAVRTIYWLFVTEYATLNSQADFNSALDANGFRQGGLGIGVSDWTADAWNAYNGYAPLIPCGILDEYGSGTAIKNFSVYNADTILAHTFSCNKYRGIEMPFAHIWKYCDGVLVNVESGDGVSTVYATTDTSYFSSTSFANYVEICNSYRVDSYIKDIVFNKEGDIFAITPNGNSTSYYCDQHWGGNLPSATELRAWRFGGAAFDGARCGLACSHSYGGVGTRFRSIGSRLCFVP